MFSPNLWVRESLLHLQAGSPYRHPAVPPKISSAFFTFPPNLILPLNPTTDLVPVLHHQVQPKPGEHNRWKRTQKWFQSANDSRRYACDGSEGRPDIWAATLASNRGSYGFLLLLRGPGSVLAVLPHKVPLIPAPTAQTQQAGHHPRGAASRRRQEL